MMFGALNFASDSGLSDNSGVVIVYSSRQGRRLAGREGSLVLLYQPTHATRAMGYFAAGRLTSMKTIDDGASIAVYISADFLFHFQSPVPFRFRGKMVEYGLGVPGRAGMQVRDISQEDFLRIVALGFGGEERVPYALMRAIEGEQRYPFAAEDGEPPDE